MRNMIPLGRDDTCAAVLAGDDVRCTLQVGHGGAHEQVSLRGSAQVTTWWYEERASPRHLDLRPVGDR